MRCDVMRWDGRIPSSSILRFSTNSTASERVSLEANRRGEKKTREMRREKSNHKCDLTTRGDAQSKLGGRPFGREIGECGLGKYRFRRSMQLPFRQLQVNTTPEHKRKNVVHATQQRAVFSIYLSAPH